MTTSMNIEGPEADPRLPAVYDTEYGWAADDDFFLALVNRRPRSRVLDLGCGTGRLTTAMAAAGHTVTGVDPNAASLQAAREKPHADRVTWIHGDSTVLGTAQFDVAVMTSHVAQIFLADEAWRSVLVDLRRALVPGGVLAFDARDPQAQLWQSWSRPGSLAQVTLADGTPVQVWTDVVSVDGDLVTFSWHNVFPDGARVEGTSTLRFRSEDELRGTLEAAGFRVEQLSGGWHGEPVGSGAGEFVVVARAVPPGGIEPPSTG